MKPISRLAPILALLALATLDAAPALAQGPGGGGFNPGGGGSSGGSFSYDSLAVDSTNADRTVLRTDGGLLYRWVSSPTAVSAPAAVKALAPGLFAGCTALKTADLSASAVTELPADCFAGCTALTTVKLPASCTAIGPDAFAGCIALASVDAPGVVSVGADAFRGCTSLAALPAFAGGAAIGDYAFAASGLTAADAEGLDLSPGVFAGCTSLASLANTPATLPDALCAGCTALDFPGLEGKTLGAAALAGIPTAAFSVDSATVLGDYSLAASEATVETMLDLADGALPVTADTAFMGRSVGFTPAGTSDTAALGAFHLVSWLQEQATAETPIVAQPDSYATADLETWLARDGNAASYAFASQIEAGGSFAVLGLSGDGNGFIVAVPDDGISIAATPVATYSLAGESPEWLASNLTLDPDTGIYHPSAETSTCFATLLFTWDW